jgi:hypothetical protein
MDNIYVRNIKDNSLIFVDIEKFEEHPNDGFFILTKHNKTLYIFDQREGANIESLYNEYFRELNHAHEKKPPIPFEEIIIEVIPKTKVDKIYDIFAI